MKYLALFVILVGSAFAQWPGQAGNLVGHTQWPGWSGSFNATACSAPSSGTNWSNAVVISNCTYSTSSHTTISCNYCEFILVDFKSSATNDNNAYVTGSNIIFAGDRFQSNYIQGANVSVTGSNIYFFYDSVVPLVSYVASPPGSSWPSAGAGANSTTMSNGVNMATLNQAYEIGIEPNNSSGPMVIDHCDIWGFGNAIQILTTTAQITITSNWIHDGAYPSGVTGGDYHTDGIGYLNGSTGPNNVWMIGNAIATLGNTNSLAFQAATGGYQNIYANENFLSGDNATISWCRPGSVQCTNSTFYGNTWGATVAANGPIYSPGSALGTGSVWACNVVSIPSGTTWTELNSPFWQPNHSQDGQFFLNTDPPNSTTDQGSNTYCGIPSPSAINFGNEPSGSTSSGQTITFSNTNSGTLTFSGVALVTGTQFTISSNTCSGTLTASNTCSITVKFAPTSMGPQTDTLQITTNTPGVSSPQLVPLAGIGTTSTGATPNLIGPGMKVSGGTTISRLNPDLPNVSILP